MKTIQEYKEEFNFFLQTFARQNLIHHSGGTGADMLKRVEAYKEFLPKFSDAAKNKSAEILEKTAPLGKNAELVKELKQIAIEIYKEHVPEPFNKFGMEFESGFGSRFQ